jgi:hypothetical protein
VNRYEEIIGFALFFAVILLLAMLHGRDVHGFKVLLEHPTELGEDSLDRVSDIVR